MCTSFGKPLLNYLIKLVKVNNPITIPIFVGGWYAMFNLVKRLNPRQSSAWHSNVLNFVHDAMVSSTLLYKMINSDETKSDDLNYDTMIAFFLYDLTRTPIGSVFFYHHIISLISVSMIRVDKTRQLKSKIFLAMEIGNLPLYIVCGLMLSRHKQYWKSHMYMKYLMVFEFPWYIFFRCILSVALFVKVRCVLYKFIVFGFGFSSVLWTKNMFQQLKNIKLSKRFEET